MTVGVQGDADVGMPGAFLHDLGVHTGAQELGCVAVARRPANVQLRAGVRRPAIVAGRQPGWRA